MDLFLAVALRSSPSAPATLSPSLSLFASVSIYLSFTVVLFVSLLVFFSRINLTLLQKNLKETVEIDYEFNKGNTLNASTR